MDPSAFIFVGLAIAWAAYLIPKALEHHDAGARSRSVEKFSHTMRVIARREPVDRSTTRLVPSRRPAAPTAEVVEEPTDEVSVEVVDEVRHEVSVESGHESSIETTAERTGFFAAQTFVRRSAASHAVRRRRRVLATLLLLTAMVGAACAGQVISAWWIAAPVALLAGWLVACRLMVRNERAARPVARRTPAPVRREAPAPAADVRDDDTTEVPAVRGEVAAEPIASGDGWELVPVTLPTYVSKPAAPRRTVSTIDLDSTGVWTSGRTAADSALAQQADAVRATGATGATEPERRRASGA